MRIEYDIEQTVRKHMETNQKFGASDIDTVAAALYSAFHGKCECASHPFHWDDEGEFHGYLPWRKHRDVDDAVVTAFRVAAIAAFEAIRDAGIGGLK